MSRRILQISDPDFWDPSVFLPQLEIRPKKGGMIPFNLTSDQLILSAAVVKCYTERRWLAYVKPRQVGSSTFFTGVVYQNTAYRRGTKGAIVANKKGQAEKLERIAMRFWKSTPDHLRIDRDTQLKKSLRFPDIDSEIEVGSVQDDEPLRGDTVQVVLCTEIGSREWASNETAWSSILNAVAGPEDGGFVFAESTPFSYGDQLHQIVRESEQPGSPWLTVFVPWTRVQAYSASEVPSNWRPRKDVLDYANEYSLTKEQAFYLERVLLPKCRDKWSQLRREYPITIVDAFGLAGEPIFNESTLLKWMREIDGDTGILEHKDEYIEFRQPEPGHRYLVTCDPASGFSRRDLFGVEVLDLTTCEQVAEFIGHNSAGKIAALIAKIGWKYNRAVIYVEANGVGEGVLSHLIEVERYPNVFCRRSSDTMRQGDALVPGFWSGASQKAAAIGFLQDLIDDGSLTIYSVRLLRQLINYRGGWEKRQRDSADGHFDLVAAIAVAAWGYFHEVRAGRVGRARTPEEIKRDAWRQVLRDIEGRAAKTNTPWGDHI